MKTAVHRFLPITAIAALFALGLLSGCQQRAPMRSARTQTSPHQPTICGPQASGFELNQGQWDSRIKFRTGAFHSLFLTDRGFVISLIAPTHSDSAKSSLPILSQKHPSKATKSFLGLEFIGANPHPEIRGERLLSGKSNYFIGSDPTKWKRNVPHYAVVRYSDIYPGIDLLVHEAKDGTEYDLLAAPGADPAQIQLGIRGARTAKLNRSGELVVDSPNGSVVGHAPRLYQDVDGVRKSVAGGYVLNDSFKVGFKVGAYDRSRPLIIDPTILPTYSTFLGGSGTDTGTGIAVDSNGYTYITGNTTSPDFPTQGAYQTTFNNNDLGDKTDVFISKLSPDGTALVYSTYLSGTGGAQASGIAVDSTGSAYVVGEQDGGGFPFTPGTYQGTGIGNDFVTKLSPDGSQLIYCDRLATYGNNGIAVDSTGNAYVTSVGPQVSKLNADGSALVYQVEPAGPPGNASAIAIDSAGEAFVAGAQDTPSQPGPSPHSFVWKLGADGSQIYIYAAEDFPAGGFTGIGVDSNGYAYAIGVGNPNGITKLDPNGNPVSFPNPISQQAAINAIAVDPSGIVYVTGLTDLTTFPTTSDAFQSQLPGQWSAIVSRIDTSGTVLLYSTYFGGSYTDSGNAIALDSQGNGYITGFTTSSDFPHTVGAFQSSLNGTQTAFVAKFEFPVVPTPTPTITQTPTSTPTATAKPIAPTLTPTPRKTSAPLPTRTPDGTASATVTQTPTPLPTPAVPSADPPVAVGPSALSVLPRGISFGPMHVDRRRVGTIRVRNIDKAPITIEQVQYSGSDEFTWNSNCGQVIAAGVRCEIQVNFSATTTEGASGSINVFSNTPFSPQTVLLKGR